MVTNKEVLAHEKLVETILKSFVSSQRRDCIVDIDELRQVGMIAVYKALTLYNKSKGSLKNYLITAIKHALNRQIKFDMKSSNNIPEDSLINIEDAKTRDMDFRIDTKIMLNKLKKIRMDRKNKELVLDRLRGMGVRELSRKYGLSSTRIYGILHRFKDYIEVNDDNRKEYN